MDIIIYQPFVNEIKELIHKKQFQAIKMVITETINLYWEIGEEIYCQKMKRGGENPLFRYCQRNYKNYSDLQYETKKGIFTIGNEEDMKFLLWGIEQRYYTTPVTKENRVANSTMVLPG